MPSDKEKVLSYLEDDEAVALKELCEENDYSKSEGVKHLIRNYLIENDEVDGSGVWMQEAENRILALEKNIVSVSEERVKVWGRLREIEQNLKYNGEGISWIERQQSDDTELRLNLREEVAGLERQIKEMIDLERRRYSHWLNDDQIAAVTGQSVWKVRLWRCGLQKPRGKRIKEKLSKYEVVDGRWKKRG